MKKLFLSSLCTALGVAALTGAPSAAKAADVAASAATATAAADPKLLRRGKILFLRCRSCHSLKAGEPNKTGPNLHGFFGTEAGTNAEFAYSDAIKEAGVTWSEESLDAFVTKPTKLIPGTRMVFAGLPRENDRKALIAYLKQETSD